MADVFAVPVFFIVFRETLETSLVVSILLAFLKQQIGPEHDAKTYKKLRNQVCVDCSDSCERGISANIPARSGGGPALASCSALLSEPV
jgi:high-affinity Fe2+/Pb2+ permease